MKCPRCGYQASAPHWVYSLRFIAKSKEPIFGGLVERNCWREDKELADWMSKGLIQLVETGFVITGQGRNVIRQYGIDL